MTADFFRQQIDRLKSRFGSKNFDQEFIRVVGAEVATVSDEFFLRTVNTWIGMRKLANPPLLADFREARLAFEKSKFDTVVNRAASTFTNKALEDVLRKHYNVDTLEEAFEMERLKIKLGDVDGGALK